MLLVFDIGNTHVVFGVFDGAQLIASWRLRSDIERTVDEYALEILWLLERGPLHNTESSKYSESITTIVIGCVVPPLTRVFAKFAQKYFGYDAIVITADLIPQMEVNTDDPKTVGIDRLINAYAARQSYGTPTIVIDMGTATTFDIIGTNGCYEGGIISPGLTISAKALFDRAAMLPSIQISTPTKLIGKNTKDAMLSGIVFGYVGLIDGIVSKIQTEMNWSSIQVIGTGGLFSLVANNLSTPHRIVPDLTLQGLRIIAEQLRRS